MRLAGQQRAGYYPAPPRAVSAALMHLDTARKPFSIIDPCAGEGHALAQLALMTGGMPHGIELDGGRSEELKKRVAKALAPASAFGCKVTGSFDLMWLNPPYDDEIGGGQRVEHTWLMHFTPWLKPGGVLCFVVPERIVARYSPSLDLLESRYDDVAVMPFPADVRRFKEVIVFGYRRSRMRNNDIGSGDKPGFDTWEGPPQLKDDRVYIVPGGTGPRSFEKVELTEEEVSTALYHSKLQKLLTAPREIPLPRPPLPLAQGHIAMLLASGHLDGVVRPDGESPHVVRGTAQKKQYLKEVTEEEKADGSSVTKSVYAEKIVLSVRAVDSAGNLKTFAQE